MPLLTVKDATAPGEAAAVQGKESAMGPTLTHRGTAAKIGAIDPESSYAGRRQ